MNDVSGMVALFARVNFPKLSRGRDKLWSEWFKPEENSTHCTREIVPLPGDSPLASGSSRFEMQSTLRNEAALESGNPRNPNSVARDSLTASTLATPSAITTETTALDLDSPLCRESVRLCPIGCCRNGIDEVQGRRTAEGANFRWQGTNRMASNYGLWVSHNLIRRAVAELLQSRAGRLAGRRDVEHPGAITIESTKRMQTEAVEV